MRTSKPKLRGRPYVLSPSDRQKLVDWARRHPNEIADQLRKKIGISASVHTIRFELIGRNFTSVCMKKTSQISESAITKHLSFAREYLHKGNDFWKKVIFSDEKKWELHKNDGYIRVWKEVSTDITFESDICHYPGIMVWGVWRKWKNWNFVVTQEFFSGAYSVN